MKILLLLLVSITITYAKSKETCYYVQLTSFKLKKNSTYNFAAYNYLESCKLISFSNINTIRYGCYEKYRDARTALKKLSKHYPNPLIVNTYKYRFKKKTMKPKIKIIQQKLLPKPLHVNKPVNTSLKAIKEKRKVLFFR